MNKRQAQFLFLFGCLSGLFLLMLEGRLKGISYTSGFLLYAFNFLAISKIGAVLVKKQSQNLERQTSNVQLMFLIFAKITLLIGSLYLALVYFDLAKAFFAGGAIIALFISSLLVSLK